MILVPDLQEILRSATSDAERRVARLLHSIDAPTDAVGFHSVKLRSHPYKQQAEADFVLMWDGVVIVIEVKGGGVRKHDGVWYSVDRHEDWHRLGSSPMEQARTAMFALTKILTEDGIGWFAREAIVIAPDIESPPHDVEWRASHWLAKDQMSPEALKGAFNTVCGQRQQAPHRMRVARPLDLRTRLFGEFTLLPMMDAQRGAVLDEQNRATEGQAKFLAGLARNERIMVRGGAGTGKSMVLAEAARQEADRGSSVLITFRSPALREFFDPLVVDRDVDVIPFDELKADKMYDVILIDEAQDLMTAEVMDRFDDVIDHKRAGGRWRMFLDQNNQAHVDGAFDEGVYQFVASEATTFDLSLNVRNTKAIVHVVQEYLKADVGDPGIVNGEKVQWHPVPNNCDVTAAIDVARELVEAGVKKRDIWIICVSSDAETTTADGFVVTSPRFVKGLEAEHVVVCELPAEFDEVGIAGFYVAVTRARVSLHIALSSDDRHRLKELARRQGKAK